VAIVGEVRDVSQEVEDNLIAAGCQVERIQGTPEEIAAGLERVLNPVGPG
jgi:putative cell wall-binding protein